jgi:LacI family transcriptional regulator
METLPVIVQLPKTSKLPKDAVSGVMFEHVSIKDIARRAGVGVSTVSRVLNDHPDTSQRTRDKVLGVIREANYRPNSRARQLVKNTAETICFILNNRDVINPFHSRVLMGVARYARTLSRNVIFMQFDYAPDAPPNRLHLPPVIWERGAQDGLVIAGTNYPNFINAVKALRIPFVVFGNNLVGDVPVQALHSVWFDNEGGTRKSTEYLIELGHKNIWCVVDTTKPWYARCYEGYRRAMKQHQLRPRKLDVRIADSPFNAGVEGAKQLLQLKPRLSAIVAGDDEIALGMLSGLDQHGVRVPDDVSLVGFDDIEGLKFVRPLLTTVRVDKEKVGEELAKLLFELLEHRELLPVKRMLPTELLVRESSARPGKGLCNQLSCHEI